MEDDICRALELELELELPIRPPTASGPFSVMHDIRLEEGQTTLDGGWWRYHQMGETNEGAGCYQSHPPPPFWTRKKSSEEGHGRGCLQQQLSEECVIWKEANGGCPLHDVLSDWSQTRTVVVVVVSAMTSRLAIRRVSSSVRTCWSDSPSGEPSVAGGIGSAGEAVELACQRGIAGQGSVQHRRNRSKRKHDAPLPPHEPAPIGQRSMDLLAGHVQNLCTIFILLAAISHPTQQSPTKLISTWLSLRLVPHKQGSGRDKESADQSVSLLAASLPAACRTNGDPRMRSWQFEIRLGHHWIRMHITIAIHPLTSQGGKVGSIASCTSKRSSSPAPDVRADELPDNRRPKKYRA
jgi:hypothetical protein